MRVCCRAVEAQDELSVTEWMKKQGVPDRVNDEVSPPHLTSYNSTIDSPQKGNDLMCVRLCFLFRCSSPWPRPWPSSTPTSSP